MLYPFIYTRSMYHDYRVVTSESLRGMPRTIVHFMTEIARTLIDADNHQLSEPTWALVKKDGFLLWGIAIANKTLSDQSQDKYKRPVRGFFGFIADSQVARLPYEVSYFKTLYKTYVLPIWDAYGQTEQVTVNIPPISGFDFIEKSSRLNDEINVDDSICRVFPNTSESKLLIEAVFAAPGDCSIATNIHRTKQCVEFGKEHSSFTNAVMASDSNISKIDDIKVFVPEEIPVIPDDICIENNNDTKDESLSSLCGDLMYDTESVFTNCKNKQNNKKYLKYGLYGFMAFLCLIFVMKGSSIWEKILSPDTSHGTVISDDKRDGYVRDDFDDAAAFLNIHEPEVSIYDAGSEDTIIIRYESSSSITQVTTDDNWIKIITRPLQFSRQGKIEIVCEHLAQGKREGAVCITNKEGIKTVIPIYQISNNNVERVITGTTRINKAEKSQL